MNIHSLPFLSILIAACLTSVAANAETVTLMNGVDGYSGVTAAPIRSDRASAPQGTPVRMPFGTTGGSNPAIIRLLTGFDLSTIPAGSTINSVTVKLNIRELDAKSVDQAVTVELHKMTEGFAADTVTWDSANAAYDSAVLASTTANAKTIGATPKSWLELGSTAPLAATVQNALNAKSPAYFMVKLPDATETGSVRSIFNVNSANSGQQTRRITMVVDYTPPAN